MQLTFLIFLALASNCTWAGREPQPMSLEEGATVLTSQALESELAWSKLLVLCDEVGHRFAGSAALEQAVSWAADAMEADGLDVRLEPVTVPVWIRGEERVEMLAPMQRRLDVLTLGGSVGTPEEGIEGEVLVVSSFEDLEARSAEAQDRIVLFDQPWESYGQAVQFRSHGASHAARHGGIAALVRSPAPSSLSTPHTGAMRYEEDVPEVPAVALTTEDAAWMRRLSEAGKTIRVRLTLGAHRDGEAQSHNVIGEVQGRENPEQAVIIGCHLDSWDVGQGAQDDGAGCVIAMEAGRLLAALPIPPRRSVRVVLYANEEFGISGGKAYAEAHAEEIPHIVAAIEADTGAGQPLGFRIDMRDPETGERDEAATQRVIDALQVHMRLLQPLGADQLVSSWSGADISPLVKQGVPGLGLDNDKTGYWPIHHTRADTLDKVDPRLLARNVAAMALGAWILAEVPEPLEAQRVAR